MFVLKWVISVMAVIVIITVIVRSVYASIRIIDILMKIWHVIQFDVMLFKMCNANQPEEQRTVNDYHKNRQRGKRYNNKNNNRNYYGNVWIKSHGRRGKKSRRRNIKNAKKEQQTYILRVWNIFFCVRIWKEIETGVALERKRNKVEETLSSFG